MNLDQSIRGLVRNRVPRPLLLAAKRVIHAGGGRTCLVCGATVRRFLPQGYGHPILEELQVVGGMRKPNDECPICRANDRVRLIDLYVEHHSDILIRPTRLLHVAPEPALAEKWARRRLLDYVPADLDKARYRHLAGLVVCDLQALPFSGDSFDWVVCNHVLEHVPDDRLAMREIRRVLKPGGRAILQVPLAMRRSHTDDAPDLEDRAARVARFGQSDHVRLYGLDYYSRLAQAGLEVELWSAFAEDLERARAADLNPLEMLTIARRPGG
ncbi:MAG: methyltransferase domain-containing protein [Hyphomicrobiaceae bacterium]|nr:methyltransferase domain-containing protein [Hyphomicrobiaceae bacterium]